MTLNAISHEKLASSFGQRLTLADYSKNEVFFGKMLALCSSAVFWLPSALAQDSPHQLQNGQPAVLADCSKGGAFQQWSFLNGKNATSGFLQSAGGASAKGKFCLQLDDCEPVLTSMFDCSPGTDCSNNSFAHYR